MSNVRSVFRPAIVSLALLGVGLGGCQHLTPTPPVAAPAPVNTACTVFHAITFDRLHDTLETIRQVKAHNAAFMSLCGPSAK